MICRLLSNFCVGAQCTIFNAVFSDNNPHPLDHGFTIGIIFAFIAVVLVIVGLSILAWWKCRSPEVRKTVLFLLRYSCDGAAKHFPFSFVRCVSAWL